MHLGCKKKKMHAGCSASQEKREVGKPGIECIQKLSDHAVDCNFTKFRCVKISVTSDHGAFGVRGHRHDLLLYIPATFPLSVSV